MISLAIMTYSGYERDELRDCGPAHVRVQRFLQSIFKNTKHIPEEIVVCEDWSDNKVGQAKIMHAAHEYNVPYFLCDTWGGSSKNYNLGMEVTRGDWVICASDDEICLKESLDYFTYFLEKNPGLPLGMVGPSFVYGYRLAMHGIMTRKEDFYKRDDLYRLDPKLVYELNEVEPYVRKPYFHGRPPGAGGGMFAVRRDLWLQMDKFYERVFQPDEDYEVYVWEKTPFWCVHVPTPPVLHYGGATCWGERTGEDVYKNCEKNWESRPYGDGRAWAGRGEVLEKRIDMLRKDGTEANVLQKSIFRELP